MLDLRTMLGKVTRTEAQKMPLPEPMEAKWTTTRALALWGTEASLMT